MEVILLIVILSEDIWNEKFQVYLALLLHSSICDLNPVYIFSRTLNTYQNRALCISNEIKRGY